MATFWYKWNAEWCARPVTKTPLPLGPGVSLVSFICQQEQVCALLCKPDAQVWVNGRTPLGGLRVLHHRDEIHLGENPLETCYYSSQAVPIVTAYIGAVGVRSPKCPVCSVVIANGQRVVACPNCGRVYHQFEDEWGEKHCWSYRSHCSCGHPCTLEENALWHPAQCEATARFAWQ